MAYHYPIYNLVSNNGLARDRSNFGAREGFEQDIRVGTSAKNSHTLANITVERYPLDNGRVRFTMFIDGERFRSGILENKAFNLSPEA